GGSKSEATDRTLKTAGLFGQVVWLTHAGTSSRSVKMPLASAQALRKLAKAAIIVTSMISPLLKPYSRNDLKSSSEIDLGFAAVLAANSTTTRCTGASLAGLTSVIRVSITSAGTPSASKAWVWITLQWRQLLVVETLTMIICLRVGGSSPSKRSPLISAQFTSRISGRPASVVNQSSGNSFPKLAPTIFLI